jgi:hypothetical protein
VGWRPADLTATPCPALSGWFILTDDNSEYTMSLESVERSNDGVVSVRVSDRLAKEDYEKFVPEMERLIKTHGKIRVLFDMYDFHGWTGEALWEDVKFDVKHFMDIERLAMVGEKRWQQWMSSFCRPFTTAEVRYFESSDVDRAREWIHGE